MRHSVTHSSSRRTVRIMPSSECVALFCALQVDSSDLFNSISIFKAKQKKKNGQTKKRKREFLMNYTISVKPDSRKPVPEKEKIYLYVPISIKIS